MKLYRIVVTEPRPAGARKALQHVFIVLGASERAADQQLRVDEPAYFGDGVLTAIEPYPFKSVRLSTTRY